MVDDFGMAMDNAMKSFYWNFCFIFSYVNIYFWVNWMEVGETYHTVTVRTMWHSRAIIVIILVELRMVSKPYFAYNVCTVVIVMIVLLYHNKNSVLYMDMG